MKDVIASKDMYYDEEHDRNLAKRSALLDTPVTDFELSVRARNCLKKMKIRTQEYNLLEKQIQERKVSLFGQFTEPKNIT